MSRTPWRHTLPSSPKRAAQEGGANAASAPVPRSAEWPTPLEACTPHASHATIEGFAEAPGTSVEPISIPDTQPEARADDTSANSDNISQFTSPPVDISQDLVLSEDYETSEDNDAVKLLNPAKTDTFLQVVPVRLKRSNTTRRIS
jgi:hypothetical protein